MLCSQCRTQNPPGATQCVYCRVNLAQPARYAVGRLSAAPMPPDWFCPRCGWRNHGFRQDCEQCVTPHPYLQAAPAVPAASVQPSNVVVTPTKSRGVYIILGLFVGGLFGIHNFYAGRHSQAVVQLLLTVFGFCFVYPVIIVALWVLVELCTVTVDGNGNRMN